MKPWLKRRKNFRLYANLLAELWLEDKYNYKNHLRMTSENFEVIFQLIKDSVTKENTKTDPISLRLNLPTQMVFHQQGSHT